MKDTVIYIHGQGGNAEEAAHYQPLFKSCSVVGMDYSSQMPWEAKDEFPRLFDELSAAGGKVFLIANSIGAFFAMNSLSDKPIEKAWFISPVGDMERLITDMMKWAGVSEDELREKGEIETDFGQTLSWEYLSYVRTHPISWDIPTEILCGSNDTLISHSAAMEFSQKISAPLTVMEGGEHWFHTDEQLSFLDRWISSSL